MTAHGCPELEEFARFRALLDVIPQPAIVKDRRGRIALGNEAAARLWNRAPEQLVGLTASDLLDPASACWAEAVDTILFHSTAPKLLRRSVKVRGQEKAFRVSVAPVYLTPSQHVDGIIVVVEPTGARGLQTSVEGASPHDLAALALLRCDLQDPAKKSPAGRRFLDAIFGAYAEAVGGETEDTLAHAL